MVQSIRLTNASGMALELAEDKLSTVHNNALYICIDNSIRDQPATTIAHLVENTPKISKTQRPKTKIATNMQHKLPRGTPLSIVSGLHLIQVPGWHAAKTWPEGEQKATIWTIEEC